MGIASRKMEILKPETVEVLSDSIPSLDKRHDGTASVRRCVRSGNLDLWSSYSVPHPPPSPPFQRQNSRCKARASVFAEAKHARAWSQASSAEDALGHALDTGVVLVRQGLVAQVVRAHA